MMATLKILAVVLAVSSAAWAAAPEPCYGEGCTNITFFLGPRFGSKTLRLPIRNNTKSKEPNVEETNKDGDGSTSWVTDSEANNSTSQNSIEPTPIVRALFPRHRPVPEDSSLAVDYLDVDRDRFIFGADEKNRTSIDKLNLILVSGFLNLTGFGFTGEQAKQVLYNLSSSSKSQLTHLSLSRNQLSSLPKLFFPVELEYELQELSLDDNPLVRLDTSTRFELSRLIRLKKLSLARTGLRYLVESPRIPSLEVLDLSGNHFTSFPELSYFFMNLRVLNLSGNNITYLESYGSLKNLQILNLSSNALTTIRAKSIVRNMPSLHKLDLHNNSLKYGDNIDELFSNTYLYMAGNPWECSCPLVRYAHDKWEPIKDKEALRCTDEKVSAWPVMLLSEVDVTVSCPPRGVKGWWKVVASKTGDVSEWFRMTFMYSTFFTFLSWVLLIGTMVTVVRILRRQKKVSSPPIGFYTILDEKLDNKHFK